MPKQKRLLLQFRDEWIFRYLLRYRVATISQLLRDINPTPPRNHLSVRLKRLAQKKYLEAWAYDFKRVYSLGTKGQKWLRDMAVIPKEYKSGYLGNIPMKTHHDTLLNDVYHMLEKIEVIQNLKTHNELTLEQESTSSLFNIPDGIFRIRCDAINVVCALELELTIKAKSRYDKVLHLYHKDRLLPVVFYITKSQEMKRAILKMNKDFLKYYSDKIFITTLDQFIKNTLCSEFESSGGNIFSFQQLLNRSTNQILQTLTNPSKIWTPMGTTSPHQEQFSNTSS